MNEDAELLRSYVNDRSESAFAELVRRYVNLVYSAALRQVGGDIHLAGDVTQSVFVDLARKAEKLTRHASLAGWLYTSVHYAAANARRANLRRQQRELEAHAMNAPHLQTTQAPEWEQLMPILDEAMHGLREQDRNAILFRFFDGRTMASVGAGLGVNENAARKRVERALERLRTFFQRRGLSISTVALADVLATHMVSAAPAGLAALATNASMLATSAAPGLTIAFLQFMSLSKAKIIGIGVTAGLATGTIYQGRVIEAVRNENNELRAEIRQLLAPKLVVDSQVAATDLSPDQFKELMRLRGEVGLLKQQLAEQAKAGTVTTTLPKTETPVPWEDRPENQMAITKMNDARLLMMALYRYANENKGQFPTNFHQAETFVVSTVQRELNSRLGSDPAELQDATNRFEIVFGGRVDDLNDPAKAIVLREKEAWQGPDGSWNRAYAFADGHSEIHRATDGDFSRWEHERMPWEHQ